MTIPTIVPLTDIDRLRAAGIEYPSTVDAWRWLYRCRTLVAWTRHSCGRAAACGWMCRATSSGRASRADARADAAPPWRGDAGRVDIAGGATTISRADRVRIVVVIDPDTATYSPRELRAHAADAWRDAVMRARAGGRVELAVADELIRAMPRPESRR